MITSTSCGTNFFVSVLKYLFLELKKMIPMHLELFKSELKQKRYEQKKIGNKFQCG